MTGARHDRGFTLIEIMAAVAILGTGLLVLLDAHYAALRLFNDAREAVLMQGFLGRTLGQAEVEDQHIEVRRAQQGFGSRRGRGVVDDQALGIEPGDDTAGDQRVVFDKQHVHGEGPQKKLKGGP